MLSKAECFFCLFFVCAHTCQETLATVIVLEAELDIRFKCTRNPECILCTDRIFSQACSYFSPP